MSFLEIFRNKQKTELPKETTLTERDIKKLMKNLKDDIFGNECAEWSGVICNKDKPKKGQYINFYMNQKKQSLHRVLYQNFVSSTLGDKQYLQHTCSNKRCCCINHLIIKKDQHNVKKEDLYKIDFEINFA